MKTFHQILMAAFSLGAVVACNNTSSDEKLAADMNRYVDSVGSAVSTYSKETWEDINAGYERRMADLKAEHAELSAAAKEELNEAERKFNEFRTRFESSIREEEARSSKLTLRNSLFGEGKIGNDMSFAFLTAANAQEVYTNFVNTVEKNKDSYTREDWDEIKVLYEAMDNRKNEIEKNLAAADNRQIAKQKIRFVGIKAANRISAKVEENTESKQ